MIWYIEIKVGGMIDIWNPQIYKSLYYKSIFISSHVSLFKIFHKYYISFNYNLHDNYRINTSLSRIFFLIKLFVRFNIDI